MSVKKLNKSSRLERNQTISNGLRNLPSKTMIPMNGKLVRASDAAEVFEIATEAEKEVTAARAKYLQTVAMARTADVTIKSLIQPIKSFVQNSFGERSDTAASFGFEPRKPRRRTTKVEGHVNVFGRAIETNLDASSN